MGLGAPRKRLKLSRDPNNTAWSRSATRYGQKVLQSHGWMPGKMLGVNGAPYSDLRSAASASHVRITLKDDKMGLGAKHEAARDSNETTGLDVFQDLLGRLNGRSTKDLKQDRIQRSTFRSSTYIDQRWGYLQFVSGGLLVGADLGDLAKVEQDASSKSQPTPSHYVENGTLPDVNSAQEVRPETPKRKKKEKRKTSGNDHGLKETSKRVDWSIKRAQPPRKSSAEPEQESHTSPKELFDQAQMDKVRRHAEKAERKLERRAKKRNGVS
ncbi:telomerase inhibitor [Imshaugia aleurites]|uniref:Telomerase inhibitor n=1 Tax=Imshaugia aleurites TaxID=172621 RepID=A0A8H3G728_9LECA|nr:telomerase inhibitor [Imshaugia aleurites]